MITSISLHDPSADEMRKSADLLGLFLREITSNQILECIEVFMEGNLIRLCNGGDVAHGSGNLRVTWYQPNYDGKTPVTLARQSLTTV